jgi:hypothetical protein
MMIGAPKWWPDWSKVEDWSLRLMVWTLLIVAVAQVWAYPLPRPIVVEQAPPPLPDLAELQLIEDCQAACDPYAPELVAGACYCRTDLVAP